MGKPGAKRLPAFSYPPAAGLAVAEFIPLIEYLSFPFLEAICG